MTAENSIFTHYSNSEHIMCSRNCYHSIFSVFPYVIKKKLNSYFLKKLPYPMNLFEFLIETKSNL